jgi:hypothetical protein
LILFLKGWHMWHKCMCTICANSCELEHLKGKDKKKIRLVDGLTYRYNSLTYFQSKSTSLNVKCNVSKAWLEQTPFEVGPFLLYLPMLCLVMNLFTLIGCCIATHKYKRSLTRLHLIDVIISSYFCFWYNGVIISFTYIV